MKKLYACIPVLLILFSSLFFFYPFFLQGKLPIPSDTIVGLYYPFRDLYTKTNPNGLPYKNFLITDPVRQQYPWKNLAITLEKKSLMPLWNPYEMAGTPLLANFQSSPFYPLNFIFLFAPFYNSWSIFVILQPMLAGIFLYLYLKNLKLNRWSAFLGAITFSFCGFSIAWMEWGVVSQTALWLPLLLLSTDKILITEKYSVRSLQNILWSLIYIVALSASLLAGHLQIFFYVLMFSFAYLIFRAIQTKHVIAVGQFLLYIFISGFLTFFQWYQTLQYILLSNRSLDQSFTNPGWFIPYQNLVQFLSPDYFGNPSTLNYFGVWNYAEFIGYIGVISLIFSIFAILCSPDRRKWFFSATLFISLVFSLPNLLSFLPYILKIPFISTAQPTRLMFITDFSLSVLAAFGLDFFLKKSRKIWIVVLVYTVLLLGLWAVTFPGAHIFSSARDALVARSNLKLPTIIFSCSALLLLGYAYIRNKKVQVFILILIFGLGVFDLFRFGWKFTPFTDPGYLYPKTQVTDFLERSSGVFRIATTDDRILPPNFSVVYRIQSIEGYDPLYLKSYAEFIAANERSDHSIKPPFGFNRIITPRNLSSQAIDFLNVKYILSLTELTNPKFKKIKQYGETRIYENTSVFPRAYFVKNTITAPNDSAAATLIFSNDLKNTAVVTNSKQSTFDFSVGEASIISYAPNKVVIKTVNDNVGFLVFSDTNYPFFHATIDGSESKILPVNIAFRGLVVPGGKHIIVFAPKLF